jgi:RND family efflux transporter MFP subunit
MPVRKSTVGSPVGGRITEVFVDAGQDVGLTDAKSEFDGSILGEPIAQLRTTTLDLEIEAGRIGLAQAELAAAELKATLPTEIAQAQATVAEIESRLEYSRLTFERLTELHKTSGVSERELQEANSNFRSQRELLTSAQATLKKLTATEKLRLDQADAEVDAKRTALRRLLELRENYTIRAPFDGTVISKLTESGQWVAPGDAVAEIVQLDPIELVINVPQDFVPRLQRLIEKAAAEKRPLAVQVGIDSIEGLHVGEVSEIVPQADLRSRAFPVKVRLANPRIGDRPLIMPGMLGRASFFVGNESDVLMVKKDALVLGSPTTVVVAALNPDGKSHGARPVAVEIGASMGDWISVMGPLKETDQVVVQGNERLFPGQAITIVSELPDTPPVPIDPAAAPSAPQNTE